MRDRLHTRKPALDSRCIVLGSGSTRTDALDLGTVDLRHSYAGTRRDKRMVLDLAGAGFVAAEVHHYPLEEPAAFPRLEHGREL